ncbi:MAG: hypothetical protein ACRD3Q_10550, partial [Terriglobales bacterium]
AMTGELLVVAGVPAPERRETDFRLRKLFDDIERARALAAGAKLEAVVDAPIGSSAEDAFMAVPGESFQIVARFSTPGLHDADANITLKLPQGWKSEVLKKEFTGKEVLVRFRVHVPEDAKITRPYWHRNDPERDTLNTIDDAQYEGWPFPPPPVLVISNFDKGQLVGATCMVRYKDSTGAVTIRPVAVAPAFSVLLDPSEQVIATEDGPSLAGKADLESNLKAKAGDAKGKLKLEAPSGWQPEPPITWLTFDAKDEQRRVDFKVVPGTRREGHAEVSSSFTEGEHIYKEGYSVVTRDDLGTFYYYQPAVQRVSVVNVKVPHDLKVGYVMGAGDNVATVLEQIGMHVTMIPAQKLATEELSQYKTIVLGIRAYDTQRDVIANNQRLLDYVKQGGRLVVQYNTMGSFGVPIDFNAGKYTPYPTTLSRRRVSVEEAPVKILDPSNEIFHYPNEISEKDFDGWVQERGLYFMSEWAPEYTPLLESHDPGEPEQKG